jgi:hypothetical protein
MINRIVSSFKLHSIASLTTGCLEVHGKRRFTSHYNTFMMGIAHYRSLLNIHYVSGAESVHVLKRLVENILAIYSFFTLHYLFLFLMAVSRIRQQGL